jgi:glycosyltransferase involved in cell wall biosynthesis
LRVLHILTQRPALTGSGVSLDALTRCAAAAGVTQRAVVGVPAGASFAVAGLDDAHVRPLYFETDALPIPVPGMSDVMPYRSTVFSSMTDEDLERYRKAWRAHLADVLADFRPDVIHASHLWLVGALLKDVAPDIPVVSHCHATGLRQMQLCPHLAAEVRDGCRRNDAIAVLHAGHADWVRRELAMPRERIAHVGAGYREDIFSTRGNMDRTNQLLYVGKYSKSKGLPQLLDAVSEVARSRSGLVLHIAGSGAGEEADALRDRMSTMAPRVVMHGALGQADLADLMNRCAVCVLPSFYEGVPLVLAEALACGCRLVATDLPGVVDQLATPFGAAMDLIETPRLVGADVPDPDDLPVFTARLADALVRALDRPELGDPRRVLPGVLDDFTWTAVYRRVAAVWSELVDDA